MAVLSAMEQPEFNKAGFQQLISGLDQDQLTAFQHIANLTHHVVTPANAIDALSFVGAMYGLRELESWKGILISGASFMADYVDGIVARATGTQSELGEAVDAVGDKLKLALGLYTIWQHDLAPKQLLTSVAVLHGINTAVTATDRLIHDKPVMHATWLGKRAIFMEQWGIGLHVIGSKISQTSYEKGSAIKAAGTALGYIGVGLGVLAGADYAATLWESRKTARNQ